MLIRTVVLLAIMATAPAVGADARSQLDAFSDGLDSLAGNFEQVTIDGTGRVVEEARGQLYFSRPNLFRWDYEDPFPQQIVADGDRLWHYDESLDQVTVRDQPDAGESPLLVLTQPELLDRFYRMRAASDDPDLLEFVPLAEDAEFEVARLHFRSGMPEILELHDRFGQLTRLVLADLERNPEIDPATFHFVPPPGVDVLEGY